jgi:hypothetical protein
MGSPILTTARRRLPRTTSCLRCVAAFHLYYFISTLGGLYFIVAATREMYPDSKPTGLIVYGLLLSSLFLAVAVGLLRRSRLARWVAVMTSLLIALGQPVIGIALIMYLIRPELNSRFI